MKMNEFVKKYGTHGLGEVVKAALIRANPEFMTHPLAKVTEEMLNELSSALQDYVAEHREELS